MHYKVYNTKELERLLKKNGYALVRYSGSHKIWGKEGFNCISVPQSLNAMVVRRLIKSNNLKEY